MRSASRPGDWLHHGRQPGSDWPAYRLPGANRLLGPNRLLDCPCCCLQLEADRITLRLIQKLLAADRQVSAERACLALGLIAACCC